MPHVARCPGAIHCNNVVALLW